LYIIFGAISGIIGTSFSVIMRMELSTPGNAFLSGDTQLYNVITTARAFVMSAGQESYSLGCIVILILYVLNKRWLIPDHVKHFRGVQAEPVVETHTSKPKVEVVKGVRHVTNRRKLCVRTTKLMNLIKLSCEYLRVCTQSCIGVYLSISTHIIRRTKVFWRDTTSERREKNDSRGPTNKILNYGTVRSPKGGLNRVPNKYVYSYDINFEYGLCGDGAPIVGGDFNMSDRINGYKGLGES
jgi:hypothetical protein